MRRSPMRVRYRTGVLDNLATDHEDPFDQARQAHEIAMLATTQIAEAVWYDVAHQYRNLAKLVAGRG